MEKYLHINSFFCCRNILLINLFFCLSFGCIKEEPTPVQPCEEEIQLEDIKPFGQSFSWLAYESNSDILFKNETGNELVFSFREPGKQQVQSVYKAMVICEKDSSLKQIVSYQIIKNSLRFSMTSNVSNPLRAFVFELTVLYDEFHPLENNRLDVLRIFSISQVDNENEQRDLLLEIPIYNKNYEFYQDQSKQLQFVNFGVKGYSNVYVHSATQTPGLYFNKQFGVVAFQTSDGDLWIRQ